MAGSFSSIRRNTSRATSSAVTSPDLISGASSWAAISFRCSTCYSRITCHSAYCSTRLVGVAPHGFLDYGASMRDIFHLFFTVRLNIVTRCGSVPGGISGAPCASRLVNGWCMTMSCLPSLLMSVNQVYSSSLGNSTATFWDSCLANRSGPGTPA